MANRSFHRIVGAVFLVAAAVLAGGAFATAYTAAPASSDAPPADAAAPTPRAEGIVARANLALDVLGSSVARTVSFEREAPAPVPGVADSSSTSRGVDADTTPLGIPVSAAFDLELGLMDIDRASLQESSSASSQAAAAREVSVVPGAFAAAALAAAAFGALAWFWPTVKEFAWRVALAPLYAHITRAEVFENEVRERLYHFVKSEPGISASELSSRSNVSWGTTIYHLDVLEQNRMVVSVKDGRYRRYFENGGAGAVGREATAALRNPVSASIAERVNTTPGLTQKDLARSMGISPQALHWHAERLLRAGVVTKVREGRVVRFYRGA